MTPIIPQPEVLEEINALFSWNPPCLIPPRNNKSSAARPSSFYNKHLSSKLVLKRVERLPSLVQDLANNVDKALDTASTTLPPLKGFFTAERREDDLRNLVRFVEDENAVGEFYGKTTATYCSQVASTLALHPSAPFSKWQSLLYWTQSDPSSCYESIRGRLCFIGEECIDPTNKTWAVVVERMESEKRRVFEEMGKSMSALATWEIKSPSTGTTEVMNAVLNLGKFHWTYCNAFGYRSTDLQTKGVVVGPDAQTAPWSFPDDISDIQRPVTRRVTRSAASGSSTLPPSSTANHESPTKLRGKKRKRNEEEERYEAAQILVQQAWAQAVKGDGTVIVLHSGNHEIVCVRHRGSQTLYVSDVIEPPTCVDPGYGKLHVGIYIATVQDVMDRKQQQLSIISQPQPLGDGDDLRFAGRKVHTDVELLAIEKTIYVARERDVVLLYLQYDVYDSPIPASFLRSAPSVTEHTRYPTPPFSPPATRTCGLEECLRIVLTSEIGQGATGVVHRGTLKPEICDDAMPLDVVVKLAFDAEQRDALKREYEVYRCLMSKGVQGIATVLGLFDDSGDDVCALVMLYAGVQLVTEPRYTLSDSDRKSALLTLASIHRAGVLHGDIRPENILIGDSGVTIIDLGHSKRCDNQKTKDKEFAQLRNLLGFESLANVVLPSL